MGFPGCSVSKESTCKAGDAEEGSIPGSGRSPWRRAWQPTPVFIPGEFHGQRSLAGYSPWGHEESDTTEATEHACTNALLGEEELEVMTLSDSRGYAVEGHRDTGQELEEVGGGEEVLIVCLHTGEET